MRDRPYYLGIDVGTQGSKGVLMSPNGVRIAQEFREHGVIHPQPGWAEHDPEKHWWGDVVGITRAILSTPGVEPEDIAAVCVSGLIPDFAPTDAAGNPLCNAILYSDNRAMEEIGEINDRCGLTLTSEEITPKLLWFLRRRPELAKRMRMMFNAHSYVVYKLTGAYTTDTVTACLWGAIYSARRNAWREETCEMFGIPVEILPSVYPPATVLVGVTEEASRTTGLAAGTPVLVGSADVYLSLLGAGVTRSDEAMIYYGTGGLAVFPAKDLKSLANAPYDVEDGYPLLYPSYHPTSGEIVRWFRDQFGKEELEEAKASGLLGEQVLDREAARIPPGAGGLIVLPHFLGQRSPVFDPLARGAFVGLTMSHTRAHLYRAVLEAYGYGTRHSLEVFLAEKWDARRVVATGGGARSALWRQIVSDITGLTQEYVSRADAPVGDAFLAAYATGAIDDFDSIKASWLEVDELTRSDPGLRPVYDELYGVFQDLNPALKDISHRLHRFS